MTARLAGRFLPALLNMTISGSAAILAVCLLRLVLSGAPKRLSRALWGVVLFRLLCPVSLSAPLSLLRPLRVSASPAAGVLTEVSCVPVGAQAPGMHAAAAVWLAGALAMAISGAISDGKLRRRLRNARRLSGNVYLAEGIPSPLILGLLRPRIYLLSGLDERERALVLRHERCHLRRGDHIAKALGYLALCLHWFNPLVWLAFSLAGGDLELSCDEAALRGLDRAARADYAALLLRLSSGALPLAFGSGDVRGRIRHLASERRSALRYPAADAALCVLSAVCLLANPMPPRPQTPAPEPSAFTAPARTPAPVPEAEPSDRRAAALSDTSGGGERSMVVVIDLSDYEKENFG